MIDAFLGARDEANELQDASWQQVATLLAQVSVSVLRLDPSGAAASADEFKFQVLALVTTAPAAGDLRLRRDLAESFYPLQTGDEAYRVLVKRTHDAVSGAGSRGGAALSEDVVVCAARSYELSAQLM